jgi:hypothetical protein
MRRMIAAFIPCLAALAGCRLLAGTSEETGAVSASACSGASGHFPSTGGAVAYGISGAAVNAVNGSALPGATVRFIPQSALLKTSETVTDASGGYRSGPLPSGSYTVEFSLAGYIPCTQGAAAEASGATANCALSPALAEGQFRVVLTWTGPKAGAVPDVDSYLQVPGDPLPVYYGRRNGTGANLDLDRTSWYGPETITITAQQPGTYVYYFNNFSIRSDLSALYNSDVVATVYSGSGCARQYAIRPGSGITYELFHLTNGVIQDVEAYNDSLTVF